MNYKLYSDSVGIRLRKICISRSSTAYIKSADISQTKDTLELVFIDLATVSDNDT